MRRSSPALSLILPAVLFAGPARGAEREHALSLAGAWSFRLDPEGKGLAEGWHRAALPETIRLPGSTDEAGFGVPNTKDDGFAHLSRLVTWSGPAWYARDVEVPREWEGKRLTLFLERCHWQSRAWIDDRDLGSLDSLSVPHVHDLGTEVAPGTHRIALRIDNSYLREVGHWAHSVTDETQTNWNGVVGRIELRATDPVWIDDAQVCPGPGPDTVVVRARLGNATGRRIAARIRIAREPAPGGDLGSSTGLTIEPEGQGAEIPFALGAEAERWSEFRPALHAVRVELHAEAGGRSHVDRRVVPFGLRTIGVTAERRLAIDGAPILLRGTLECCIFPRTGYPPMEEAPWERLLGIARDHGLNHLRFHSWCPPEAAFRAADRLGFYFQVEGPFWVGNWGKDPDRDRWAEEEMRRIQDAYGNHPSFVLCSIGNEPGGDHSAIHGITKRLKERDPRRLYMSGTGWGQGPDDDYAVTPVRGARGPATDWDFSKELEGRRLPSVSHEIGQWCVYPDLGEIPKYTGVTRARNYERILADLEAKGLLDLAPAFTRASGKLSALLYKEEVEVLLRTRGSSGFQLLDIHDFPGQGTSPVGVLDAFWDPKGVIAADEFRRFCGPTVPLARLPKRAYTTEETLRATLEVAHFGPADLESARPTWKLLGPDGRVVAEGELPARRIPRGDRTPLGAIEAPLAAVRPPAALRLVAALPGTDAANDWRVWVYPPAAAAAAPTGVLVAREWDDETRSRLASGGSVLLLPPAKMLRTSTPIRFATVFWNPNMFRQVDSMGILCDPGHAALASFPTESHADWQWHELLEGTRALVLDETPRGFRPIVQAIDSFAKNRKLGVLLEARVGPGKLLVSTLDLERDLDRRHAARQFRASLLRYAGSSGFAPEIELAPDLLDRLLDTTPDCLAKRVPGATASADSEAPGFEAARAIDGDPDTIWHTPWEPAPAPLPHRLRIDLGSAARIAGVVYVPRQDMANGRIAEYAIRAGDDPAALGDPIAKGRWPNDAERRTVKLSAPVTARWVELEALAEVNRNAFAAVAEIDLILEK